MIVPAGKECDPYAERKPEEHPKSKGPLPGGACHQAERGAADHLKMGTGSFP